MNDLLAERTSGSKAGGGLYDVDLEMGHSSSSVQMTGRGSTDKDLSQFFAEIEKIKVQMDSIRELLVKRMRRAKVCIGRRL
jgi:syntaxin 1B/2/3